MHRALSRLLSLVAFAGLAAVTAGAVERVLRIEAPARAAPGAACPVVLVAGTDAGQGERIGLFQADFSLDGGRTWTGLCYLDNLGADTRQERNVTAGAAGSTIRIRFRVAFRDGLAGDVDYRGAAIRWHADWNDWREPPARHVTIDVR